MDKCFDQFEAHVISLLSSTVTPMTPPVVPTTPPVIPPALPATIPPTSLPAQVALTTQPPATQMMTTQPPPISVTTGCYPLVNSSISTTHFIWTIANVTPINGDKLQDLEIFWDSLLLTFNSMLERL